MRHPINQGETLNLQPVTGLVKTMPHFNYRLHLCGYFLFACLFIFLFVK